MVAYILLEKKCDQEDQSVGGNVKDRIGHRLHNITAYAWVLSGSFSLQCATRTNKCWFFMTHITIEWCGQEMIMNLHLLGGGKEKVIFFCHGRYGWSDEYSLLTRSERLKWNKVTTNLAVVSNSKPTNLPVMWPSSSKAASEATSRIRHTADSRDRTQARQHATDSTNTRRRQRQTRHHKDIGRG